MTLASGADVKIGAYEWMLDGSEDDYVYIAESLYSDSQEIVGLNVSTANPNVLVWAADDWSGGAEEKYYQPELPDTYWYGKANPRIRGALNSIPAQAQNTANLTSIAATEAYFVEVGGNSWLFADRQVFYSTDGITWTAHAGNPILAAGYIWNGATHDGNLAYGSASNGTTRRLIQITSTTTTTVAVNNVTSTARTFGMAMLEGMIYLWTGGSLIAYPLSTATLPLTHKDALHRVHTPFAQTLTSGGFAGIAASEASIFYFSSFKGTTHVFEYKFNGATNTFIGRPVWNPPKGFTARYITVSMGIVYLLGEYGDQIALLGLSTINREPQILSYVGQTYGAGGVTMTPRALAPSYGAQILLAIDDATTTFYFVYDAELDSLSELDERTIAADGTCYAVSTFGNRRLSMADSSTTVRVNRWVPDFDTPGTGTGFTLVSPAWHIGYPYDEKLLFGFQVVQDPSQTSGTVQVEYQKDEDGTWTSAGTTSAGVKYTNIDVTSSNVKFRLLRLRLTGASGARLFSVTTRAYVNSYQELWKLKLKLQKENTNREGRPSLRAVDADTLRDYLNTLITNRNTVTFQDGRYYRQKGGLNVGFKQYTVVVEFPRGNSGVLVSRARGENEGFAEVWLRSTAP